MILIPKNEVINRIMLGEICVGGTIAAIFMGLKFLNQDLEQP